MFDTHPGSHTCKSSCVIAATNKTFIIILTKQNFAETPRIVQSFALPLDKVELVEAKKGLVSNWLTLKVDGHTTKLQLVKIIRWNDFTAFEVALR